MTARRRIARAAVHEAGKPFVDFANETGSPYHTVAACARMLQASGFAKLHDGSAWSLQRGGKYFVTKDGSDVMAFVVGEKFDALKASGFSMVGAHTDSPCLRLRPNSRVSGSGMLQVGVQTYGGGLWHTWFDRPLGLAGKVVVRDPVSGQLAEKLVRMPQPLMIIPNLAIHLTNAEERKAFSVNAETDLQPVLCSKLVDDEESTQDGEDSKDGIAGRHHRAFLKMLSQELDCGVSDIADLDLCLMDAQPSNLVGLYSEFISSPRIDNLLSTWAAVKGLCDYASSDEKVAQSEDICVAASFDHEECGSQSAVGADGETFPSWLGRILAGMDVPLDRQPEIYARSFMVSADCAHGVHPNYSNKHQGEHRPDLHKGVVIKTNANQRYATTALTSALFREVCQRASVPVQDFVVRNDTGCGSTIGPIISSKLGVRTIDVGAPQWAMHSCRETCATSDAAHLLKLCSEFFASFRAVDSATSKL